MWAKFRLSNNIAVAKRQYLILLASGIVSTYHGRHSLIKVRGTDTKVFTWGGTAVKNAT